MNFRLVGTAADSSRHDGGGGRGDGEHRRRWHNPIPGWITGSAAYAGLSIAARLVLQAICDRCDAPKHPGASLTGARGGRGLEQLAGTSRSTTFRAIDDLIAAGFVVMTQRGGNAEGSMPMANTYAVPARPGALSAQAKPRRGQMMVRRADGTYYPHPLPVKVDRVTDAPNALKPPPPEADDNPHQLMLFGGGASVRMTLAQCQDDTPPSPSIGKKNQKTHAACAREGVEPGADGSALPAAPGVSIGGVGEGEKTGGRDSGTRHQAPETGRRRDPERGSGPPSGGPLPVPGARCLVPDASGIRDSGGGEKTPAGGGVRIAETVGPPDSGGPRCALWPRRDDAEPVGPASVNTARGTPRTTGRSCRVPSAGCRVPLPTMRNVRVEDLRDDRRLHALYRDAAARGYVYAGSQRDIVNFFGAAEHALRIARERGGDPARLFAWMVRGAGVRGAGGGSKAKHRWAFITEADEARGWARVKRRELGEWERRGREGEEDPARRAGPPAPLSRDAVIYQAALLAVRQRPGLGDGDEGAARVLRLAAGGGEAWTAERIEAARAELAARANRRATA